MDRKLASRAADKVVTPDELADSLKVSRSTIYSWRHRGQGPRGFRAGGALRYRQSEVDRWLRESGDTAAAR